MDKKTLTLIVTSITVIANLVFALTGITASVSCEVAKKADAVFAAIAEDI